MKRFVVFLAWSVAIVVYLVFGWVPGLVIALVAFLTMIRALTRTARELAPSARCPRGHVTATYGRVRCNVCSFVGEGSVWRCAVCDSAYGHMPCPTCGLSIRNPSL